MGLAGLALSAPASPAGDAAELLDVHVDQLAAPVTLVAHGGGLRGPHHLTRDRIQHAQPRQVMASQDPRHRPGRHTQLGGDPVRAATLLLANLDDSLLEGRTGTARTPMRSRGPLMQASLAP